MAYPSVTYSFTNGTTISATEVNQNFTDLINGLSDGTKDLNVSALTAAGTTNLNGAVNLGNATSDDVTVTGYLASALIPKTDDTYDLGTASLAWQDAYFDGAVYTDTISELTSAAGVTIDSLLIKDGGLDVGTMSNSGSTEIGRKRYLHGTNYNGGNAPTVTSAQGGFTVNRGVFIPYKTQDGTWRMRFNIDVSFSSATITGFTMSINGVTFPAIYQACIGSIIGASASMQFCRANTASSDLVFQVSSVTATLAIFSGDVDLNGKPTWAY